MKKRSVPENKLRVYKSVYAPTLMYSYDSWTLNYKHKKRIQPMEMRFLRRIEKKTLINRVRNVNSRKNLKILSLNNKTALDWARL